MRMQLDGCIRSIESERVSRLVSFIMSERTFRCDLAAAKRHLPPLLPLLNAHQRLRNIIFNKYHKPDDFNTPTHET